MMLIEFKRRIRRAEIDAQIERKIALAKRQVFIWLTVAVVLAVIISLLLSRLFWHLRP